MNGGVVEGLGNLREVQIALTDHLLALLKLDAANVLAGRDL